MNYNERKREQDGSSGTTDLRLFGDFLRDLGRSRSTGRRWRKAGLIETVNINGKTYVTLPAIRSFEARAAKGAQLVQTSP